MQRASKPRPRIILFLNNSRIINGIFDVLTLLTQSLIVSSNASQAKR
jgi:hypothetical protein